MTLFFNFLLDPDPSNIYGMNRLNIALFGIDSPVVACVVILVFFLCLNLILMF